MKITWLPKAEQPPAGSCAIELQLVGGAFCVFGYLFGGITPTNLAEGVPDRDEAEKIGLAWAAQHELEHVYIVRTSED